MGIYQDLKNYFRSAFREIFVYHNSSLEFRAKLFAIVAGADDLLSPKEEAIIKEQALIIYHGDEDRAITLLLATKEYVEKIKYNNDLGVDLLAIDITKLLKRNRRFVHKIETSQLTPIIEAQTDVDVKDYQRNIIEFLETLKKEYSD